MGKKSKKQDKERNKKKDEKRQRRVQRMTKREKGAPSDQHIIQTSRGDTFLTNLPPEKFDPETLAFASQFFREKDEKFRQTLCELILSGQQIEAIKLYRERNNCSLKEAKDAIDALIEELQRSHPEQFQDSFSQDSAREGIFDWLKAVLSPQGFSKAIKSLEQHNQKLEDVKHLSTEEIIQRLQNFGVAFNEQQFLQDVKKFNSVAELDKYWHKIYPITAQGRDVDFIWRAIEILWERLAPEVMNSERIDSLMQEGYELLEQQEAIKACTIWLEVWEHLKKRFTPDMKSVEDTERVFDGEQCLANWCQDLEGELHNAGLDNPVFFEKRIKYCQEFCLLFPKTDWLTIHNMKRAVAESYFALGMQEKGEAAFQSLVEEFPNYAWGYIGWGDMYCERPIHKNIQVNYGRAEELYKKALKMACGEDKSDVLERLERLEKERRKGV